jgi:hypothetical protein
MKTRIRIVMMLCILTIVVGNIYAQNGPIDHRADPAFGIKAGINIANLYDTKGDDFSSDSKIGFAGGVFFGIPLGTYLGIQPEVIYSQKGYKGSGNILLIDYEYTRNYDFLDIPILLQIKPSPILTIFGGPYFSFLLHKGIDFKSGNLTVEQQTEIKNNNIRKNILGLTGGLDFNLAPVVISGRVGWDMQNNNGDGTSTDPRFKNVWIQATLGIMF